MINNINNLLEKTERIEDEELKSHFFNYICVLISSYLEVELNQIITDYKNSRHCQRHECHKTLKSMPKINNARWCTIRAIIMNISKDILDQLEESITNMTDIKSSIDNIVMTRHRIAHGENITTLTNDNLKVDLEHINILIDKLKIILGGIE